jgi:hypothetical protein
MGQFSNNKTAAFILIGIGVVLLLVNILNIDFSRLWPLVLIAIGVYLLSGRANIRRNVQSGRFRAPLAGAETADVTLHLSVGEAFVDALETADDLIDAQLTYVGEIDFSVTGDADPVVRLRQATSTNWEWLNPSNWFGGDNFRWQIGLSPDVPLVLDIHGGLGTADLDLRPLQVTDLRLHGGAGEITATLPAGVSAYRAYVSGGVGEVNLTVPGQTSVQLEIQGGVGEITLETDRATGVRLNASGGITEVKVPPRLQRTSGSGARAPGKPPILPRRNSNWSSITGAVWANCTCGGQNATGRPDSRNSEWIVHPGET